MHSASRAARVSGILVWRKAIFWDPLTHSLSVTTGEVHAVAVCEAHRVPTRIMHCASPFVLSTKVLLPVRVLRATEATNTVLAAQDVLLGALWHPLPTLGLHHLCWVLGLFLVVHESVFVGPGDHADHLLLSHVSTRRGRRAFDGFSLLFGLGGKIFLRCLVLMFCQCFVGQVTAELTVHHGFHGTLHFNQHPLFFTFGNTAKSNSYRGGETDSGGKGGGKKKKKKKVNPESVSMHMQNNTPQQKILPFKAKF